MVAGYGNGQSQSPLTARQQTGQVRRAWGTLLAAFAVFLLLCSVIGGSGYWYRGHATVKHAACVEVVQGDRAFIRPAYQRNWSAIQLATSCVELHEGDTLQTDKKTQVLLTLWNSTTVAVFEDTEVQLSEARTTQFISRASAVTLRPLKGLLRVAIAPGAYARSRLQVEAGGTTVVMKEGEGASSGGSFIVQVTPGADPTDPGTGTVRASVRRGVAAVRVANQPGELRLAANEQTIVPPGGPPGAPTASRRDLLVNGRFDGSEGRFANWTPISTPGQVDGPFGKLATVQETFKEQEVQALEISRGMSSIDPAITGLRQILDVNVIDFPSVTLSADIKVFEQNVPGGGQLGSEFPIIVRINYYDPSGAIQNRIWGFYVTPAPNGVVPPNGTLVKPGEEVRLEVDLRDLVPQPVRLESIDIYASGHGYRARIANVAIVGPE